MMMIYFILPIICIVLSIIWAIKAVKRGMSKKKAILGQVLSTFGCMVLLLGASVFLGTTRAETDKSDSQATTTSSEQKHDDPIAFGMGLIAAALAMGLAGLGGGHAIASAAPAAIAAMSEDPKTFGKSLICIALGEAIALYGLVISFMILFGKLGTL